MNACRRTESFGDAQSTIVKDFSAFQESTWYFRHPSSVAALLWRVDARTCAITRAKFPLPGNERTPFIIPNSAGLQREGCAILKTFHGRTK